MTLQLSTANGMCAIFAASMVTLTAGGVPSRADFENATRISLGGHPVCEASAAAVVPCPHDDSKTCLLVGDNEVSDRLFLYRIDVEDDDVELSGPDEIALSSAQDVGELGIEDIEALVSLPGGEIVVFGSHSRNKKCKLQPERRRIFRGRLQTDKLESDGPGLVQSGRPGCAGLFGDERDTTMEIVCFAIEGTEELADYARSLPDKDDREDMCTVDAAFNVEGAVAVPTGAGAPRIWVGLRAPVIGGYAVLLRQAPDPGAFAFDAVAFVDLHGFGIRELTFRDGQVWGIGGPRTDEKTEHVLWRFDADELGHGARIGPAEEGWLPKFAEGLAILGKHALVLMDGDQADDDEDTCKKKSKYIVLELDD